LFTSLFVIVFLVDVFLSNNFIELIFRIIGLLVVVVFGYMMIQSVHKEIQRREELLQLTHSLERANLRLQELDRQKTEFLSIASHQLRTPLSIAKGYLELLTEGAYGKVTPETKEILKQMDKSNDHLVKLADEFLNVTRIEQGKTKFSFADKDIVELIDRVVNELKIQAKAKKLSIIWRPTKEKKMVNMDDEKIRHVIFNFIDNAIKYSNKGKIQVSWTSEKNGVAVRVKDNGFGFCKEDEVNFFQKFYRGKNVEGINVTGVGLGLFICNKFIEAHEGHVWAHSQGLGKGSEFGFWIPNKRQIKKKAE
jgi:signal transduction histidine kinase